MATEYQILEDMAMTDYADNVADLASWSYNCDHPTPFTLFLDIIGWSDEEMGEPMFDLRKCGSTFGYLEIGKLAAALTQYSDRPHDVADWIDQLMGADGFEYEEEDDE